MKWQYGVTTVPQRSSIMHTTLKSLANAGFDEPRVFVDSRFLHDVDEDGAPATWLVPLTWRSRNLGQFGNWLLGAWELYIIDPFADRYAIFEDDILAGRGLKEYLERTAFHQGCYWNCCCYPDNHVNGRNYCWYAAPDPRGLGGQALVFDNDGLRRLLTSPYLAQHPKTAHGRQSIDGVVKSCMGVHGITEMVHYPSLVKHVNTTSTLGHPDQPESAGFMGEDYDLTNLLPVPCAAEINQQAKDHE